MASAPAVAALAEVPLLLFLTTMLLAAVDGTAAVAPNILFVVYDDLRPQLSAFGHDGMKTPHFDSLAAESLVFHRAYTNYPYCAPSRNSFMSGRMPDHAQDWNFIDSFRQRCEVSPGVQGKTCEDWEGTTWTALPEFFKKHGYWTVGTGKLFHPNLPVDNDNPRSWSVNASDPGGNSGCTCPNAPTQDAPHAPMYCALPTNTTCPDVVIADTAVSYLQQWEAERADGTQQKPFFVGMGIHKPHLPWGVPREFFDMYTPIEEIPLAAHKDWPRNAPAIAYHSCHWAPFNGGCGGASKQLGGLEGKPQEAHQPTEPGWCALNEGGGPANCTPGGKVISDLFAQHARHGYYAAVSFADSLLGKLLDKARSMKAWDNTITLLTSDHGWQLGEHNEWCKTTLFELALHIPFMIRDPRPSAPYGHSGAVTAAFAENIDIYRTLADLAGLKTEVESSVDGVSLAPLLVNPDHTKNPKAKHAAFSQQAHCLIDPHTNLPIDVWTVADSCTMTPRNSLGFMGYSIRTDDWRFTAWLQWDGAALRANWSAVNATELYNHTGDDGLTLSALDDYENDNVAQLNPDIARSLMAQLRDHFAPAEPRD